MAECVCPSGIAVETSPAKPELVARVTQYFESRDHVRRGICLLNAGCYVEAETEFTAALKLTPNTPSLPRYLAECYIGGGHYRQAAERTAELVKGDPDDLTARIRHALMLWRGGDVRSGGRCSGSLATSDQTRRVRPADQECGKFPDL